MSQAIQTWGAQIPGDRSGIAYPMIRVDAQTDAEYELTGDELGELKTFIWVLTPRGYQAARRIAEDLANYGFALIYPGDRDLVIEVGRRHRVQHLTGGSHE